MLLRSGRILDYQIIDFDIASKKWRENKIYNGYGIFKYGLKK